MSKLTVKNRYGVVPNEILNECGLSLKAKGLYAFIQSKPDDWKFSAERIAAQNKDGVDSIGGALRELEDAKLLERVVVREYLTNKIIQYDYVLYDEPYTESIAVEGKAVKGFPVDGFSVEGKPLDISNKEYSKQDISKQEVNTPLNPQNLNLDVQKLVEKEYPLPAMMKVWMQYFPKYPQSASADYTALSNILQSIKKKQATDYPISELEDFTKKFAKAVQLHNFYRNKPLKTIANNIQEIIPIFNDPKGYLDDMAKPKEQAVLTDVKIVLNHGAVVGYPESRGVKIRL